MIVLRKNLNRATSFLGQSIWHLEWVCIFCAIILILVWPLSGAIAARNIALGLGCSASLTWMFFARPKISLQIILPALCLLGVPLWLWAHYMFWPTDIQAQLYDLQGTWLRVSFLVIMGTVLGFMVAGSPKKLAWVWSAMVALSFVTLGKYLLDIWRLDVFVMNDFRFPFKYKSAAVYFLMCPFLLACGTLHYCIFIRASSKHRVRRDLGLGLGMVVLLATCFADFIAARSLNAILLASLLCVILLLIYFSYYIQLSKTHPFSYWALPVLALLVLCASLTLFWQYDQKYEQKLSNIISDMQVASKIHQYPDWRRDPAYQGSSTPSDGLGRPVNRSTYERTAWFIKGVSLLQDHPLGAGFSHLAFRYFMHQENPNLALNKTHSGWLDYALGLGLPGLALTWFAMGLVFYRSINSSKQEENYAWNGFVGAWILGGVWLVWWPTEVSEREFIEHLFFIISFLAILALPNQKNTA